VDVYETGARVGRSIRALLEQRSAPVLLWRRLPMLTHMLRQTPAMQPMKDIMERAMQAERDGEVLNASVFGGFPLSDIPCAGLSVVVVAERERLEPARNCWTSCVHWPGRGGQTLSSQPPRWPSRLRTPKRWSKAR